MSGVMPEEKRTTHNHQPRKSSSTIQGSGQRGLLVWGILLCIAAALNLLRKHGASATTERPANFSPGDVWDTLPVSATHNFTWTPCYQNRECARLIVPLDYSDPQGAQAIVALVKAPARDSSNARGAVFVNPGGPGGSGTDFVTQQGGVMQAVLGENFDIIGFDPRGVGRTTPQVIVWPQVAEYTRWHITEGQVPLLNTSADAMARLLARNEIFSTLAQQRTSDAAAHVSTATVARDMLSIAHALGQDKVQYLGFSYGSLLGITFAAMFPNRVERMVVDGVIDANDWYSGRWEHFTLDTDKALFGIGETCVRLGLECPMADSSPARVVARILAVLEKLKSHPLPVPLHDRPREDYGVVTYKIAKTVLFQTLYSPHRLTFLITATFAFAEKGDGRYLWIAWHSGQNLKCGEVCPPGLVDPFLWNDLAANVAITCGDGEAVEDTAEELQARWEELAKTSLFADVLAIRASCAGWKIRPKGRFTGPFVGNTSFPILFMGTSADPVTPVANAVAMSKGFNGSVVLTQNSAGHTTISSGFSRCTRSALREYFQHGRLPAPNTVCEVDTNLDESGRSGTYSDQELVMANAWSKAGEMIIPRFAGNANGGLMRRRGVGEWMHAAGDAGSSRESCGGWLGSDELAAMH